MTLEMFSEGIEAPSKRAIFFSFQGSEGRAGVAGLLSWSILPSLQEAHTYDSECAKKNCLPQTGLLGSSQRRGILAKKGGRLRAQEFSHCRTSWRCRGSCGPEWRNSPLELLLLLLFLLYPPPEGLLLQPLPCSPNVEEAGGSREGGSCWGRAVEPAAFSPFPSLSRGKERRGRGWSCEFRPVERV